MPDRDALKPTRHRETWPDVAKGVCIVLVVLWHVVTKHYQRVDWDTSLPFSAAWGSLGEQLLPLRMPLFFTISGLFAIGAVNRPWPTLVRTRIGKFATLYAIWLLIHTAVMWFTPSFDTARARGPLQLVEQLTITPTNLWYLYALALYFLVARVTAKVPTVWLLTAAFLLSAVAAAHLLPVPSNRGQVYQNAFFFLAGLRLGPTVTAYVVKVDRRRLVTSAAAYASALTAMAALGAQQWFGVWPAVSILATWFGVTGAVLLSRHLPRPAALLSRLGVRTLPIYVIHLPLLAVLDRLLRGPLSVLEPRTPVLAAIEPVLLTALLIGACLGLHRGLRACGLRRLFEPFPDRRLVASHRG
ncbi:acyltransferase family protein [Aeromicrobium sp. 9AM]|uniref:acyltransferase family protein n=1 Tax=Aeromicrobium sp. 9AM TaxID=2653126 RepID=UPI0012F05893|nr:acyltransferase family protein [Aeromicrobium sp. 9AM]VXB38288.1 Pyridoxal-5'-phosphate-dependent protein subunit beta [Aeromicrobium sp. 9AM]